MAIYQPKWNAGAGNLLNWISVQKNSIPGLMTVAADCDSQGEAQSWFNHKPQKSNNYFQPARLILQHNLSSFLFASMKSKSLLITTSMIYSFPFQLLSFPFYSSGSKIAWISSCKDPLECKLRANVVFCRCIKIGRISSFSFPFFLLVKKMIFRIEWSRFQVLIKANKWKQFIEAMHHKCFTTLESRWMFAEIAFHVCCAYKLIGWAQRELNFDSRTTRNGRWHEVYFLSA